MSNREIEDVLSSIRRLVAREAARPAPERPAPDRLVLTEAQRIAVNESHPPTGEPPTRGADPAQDGSPGSAPDTAGADTSTDPISDAAPMPSVRPEAPPPAGDAQHAAEPRAPGEAEQASRFPEAAVTPVAPRDQDPDHRAPSGAQAPGSADDEDAREGWHAPPSWRAAGDGTQRGQVVADALDETAAERRAFAESPYPAMARDEPVVDAVMADAAGEGFAVDAEDAEEGADGQPDPVGGQDRHEGANQHAAQHAPEPAETLIDEEMLRALVAQLVREELRGQLGERITMQVRKLVRAEVARALDEREYL